MNRQQALHSFWSSFDIPAYDETTVLGTTKEKPDFPYITYNVSDGDIYNESGVIMSASLWYKSYSWEAITEKANEIRQAISLGGYRLKCDEGMLWIKLGNPFAQRMSEETSDSIRRMYIYIYVEFIIKE